MLYLWIDCWHYSWVCSVLFCDSVTHTLFLLLSPANSNDDVPWDDYRSGKFELWNLFSIQKYSRHSPIFMFWDTLHNIKWNETSPVEFWERREDTLGVSFLMPSSSPKFKIEMLKTFKNHASRWRNWSLRGLHGWLNITKRGKWRFLGFCFLHLI